MRIKKVLWDREDDTVEDRARAEEKQQVFKDREDHVWEFCAHTENDKQQAFPEREVVNFDFFVRTRGNELSRDQDSGALGLGNRQICSLYPVSFRHAPYSPLNLAACLTSVELHDIGGALYSGFDDKIGSSLVPHQLLICSCAVASVRTSVHGSCTARGLRGACNLLS